MATVSNAEYLEHARKLIGKSRDVILGYWGRQCSSKEKADRSLVTEADTTAERVLREALAREFPTHGVIGEEFGHTHPKSEFQWSIDPIDGTQNFVHGIPTFGTVLALHRGDVPLVGIIDHPALDLCYWGARGLGAYCNGERIAIVDAPLNVNEVCILSTRDMFKRSGEEHLFDSFVKVHDALRVYYDVFGHTRAIHGQAGAMVEFNVRIWDIGATRLLVEEARGKYVELRRRDSPEQMFSAVFGKPSIVDAIAPHFR